MNIKKFRPLGDRVLVQKLEQEKTVSGILIPDEVEQKIFQGKVLAVGKGKYNAEGILIPVAVKKKDIVYFNRYAGTQVTSDCLVLKEDEILGRG